MVQFNSTYFHHWPEWHQLLIILASASRTHNFSERYINHWFRRQFCPKWFTSQQSSWPEGISVCLTMLYNCGVFICESILYIKTAAWGSIIHAQIMNIFEIKCPSIFQTTSEKKGACLCVRLQNMCRDVDVCAHTRGFSRTNQWPEDFWHQRSLLAKSSGNIGKSDTDNDIN